MASRHGGVVRRWVRRATFCAGLGVVTTILAAWGLAAWLPHRGLTLESEAIFAEPTARAGAGPYDAPTYLMTEEVRRPGMARRAWATRNTATSIILPLVTPWHGPAIARWIQHDEPGPRLRRDWGECPPGPGPDSYGFEDARGWPWLALRSFGRDLESVGAPRYEFGLRLRSEATTGYLLDERVLPLRPIWPGLLGNAAVYGAGWAAVLMFVGASRRHLRRRQGRCAACGYDLRGSGAEAGCPECGWGREGMV